MKSNSPRPPRDLSVRATRLWDELHRDATFSPDCDEYLERALRCFDLADELTAAARPAGFDTPKGRGLLAAARDQHMVGLKLFQACGLDRLDATPRRPGRPSGDQWSALRRQARPRDAVTGKLLA
jgi:hypothetical protein